tara:strand:+ start:1227 stop:2531 length:1305 start_codon:yes stop_codon:yes gene_type:complete
MRVVVESDEGLKKKLLVDLPAERVDTAVEKKLTELAKQVKLDGFRPGKAPVKVVKQRFGESVRQDVFGELVQTTCFEAATEQKLIPVGKPDILLRDPVEEGGFSYTAIFEIMPEIILADLSGQKLTKTVAEVSEKDVDEMIEKLREQKTDWIEVERPAKNGDTVHLNFFGQVDEKPFEGGSADNFALILGSGSMIEGFEDGILSSIPGDKPLLNVVFPNDYRVEALAGKAATFETEILKVSEPKLPELDEAFIKEFGIDDGSLEALRAEISKNMRNELNQKLDRMLKDAAMDLLRDCNQMEIPSAMVLEESERMKHQMHEEIKQRGETSNFDLPSKIFEEQAKQRVQLGMLVSEIIENQKLDADDDEIKEMISKLAGSYQDPTEVIDYYMNNPDQKGSIKNLVLENKVTDWVVNQVSVKEEKSTFSEVMNPNQK